VGGNLHHNTRLIIVIIVTILLGLFHINWATGWLLGNLATTFLKIRREQFYGKVLDSNEFSKAIFSRYVIFVVLVVSLTLLIPFKWQNLFNPYTVFAALMFDRIWLYLTTYFFKDDKNVEK